MTNVNIGLLGQPIPSALDRQMIAFKERYAPHKHIVPSMTESEIRYEQGMQAAFTAVVSCLYASPERVLNDACLKLCKGMGKPLNLALDASLAQLMYDAGWNHLIRLMCDYIMQEAGIPYNR